MTTITAPAPVGVLQRFDQWLQRPAPAERLAALRILLGGFVLVYIVANVGEFHRVGNVPTSPFEPVGIARWLNEPLPASAVWVLFASLIASGGAFVVGIAHRVNGAIFAALTLGWASYHSSWGQMLHFEHLFTLHLLVLAFAPAAAVWSLDAQRRSLERVEPASRFGWPIRLLAIITALTYVIAAIAKLRETGVAWIDGTTLRNHIAYSSIRIELLGGFEPPLASTVLRQQWLLPPMAVGAVAIELGAPLALAGRRLRNGWVAAALVFHAGTAATMMVFFPYQGLGFALLPLFRVEHLVQRVIAVMGRFR